MWWMSIPHVAIVSGCLLAGNNPNTLAGIIPPRETRQIVADKSSFWSRLSKPLRNATDRVVGLTFDAKYKPAWMWNRGRSKREWLLRLCEEFGDNDRQDFLPALKKKISMRWLDWLTVSFFAFLLFFIPCMFGFLVSFYTPQIGLSCRSLTFLMYGCAQTLLLLLWIWNFTWRDRDWRARRRADQEMKDASSGAANSGAGQASNNGFVGIFSRLSEARWFQRSPNGRLSAATLLSSSGISRFGCVIFWLLMAVGYAAAVFSAIGGTMMQIMGVYRNCLCQINVNTWIYGRNEANLQLSTNSAEDIEQALKYWIPMGSAASGFLGLVAYVAWWYQRRLRFRFAELVSRLDKKLPLSKSGQASTAVTNEGS
jgi:hypothetical protein